MLELSGGGTVAFPELLYCPSCSKPLRIATLAPRMAVTHLSQVAVTSVKTAMEAAKTS